VLSELKFRRRQLGGLMILTLKRIGFRVRFKSGDRRLPLLPHVPLSLDLTLLHV